jgi:putative tricarboxylic transport membrane protein
MRGRSLGWHAALADDTVLVSPQRFAGAAAAFFAYALLLVGRGLPFWLGTAIFVAGYVYLFHLERDQRTPLRRAMLALVIGTVTALVVTLVFERVFLVRLP